MPQQVLQLPSRFWHEVQLGCCITEITKAEPEAQGAFYRRPFLLPRVSFYAEELSVLHKMISKLDDQELYTHDGHAFCARLQLSLRGALRLAEVKSWALGLA